MWYKVKFKVNCAVSFVLLSGMPQAFGTNCWTNSFHVKVQVACLSGTRHRKWSMYLYWLEMTDPCQGSSFSLSHVGKILGIFFNISVTRYPAETIEVRLILSSRWNEQWKPVKKVTVKRECGSQRGYQQVLVLSNLRLPDTKRKKREAKWLAGTPKRKWGLPPLSGSK